MKVSDVIKRVRSIAGDTAVMQFSDSDIIDWLNDGIRECATQNGLLQKVATTTTVANTKEYDLPTDILKLHSVEVGGRKLAVRTLQEAQDNFPGTRSDLDTGQPTSFYVWVTKISLWPTPSGAESLVINYTYTPADLTYTDASGTSGVADGATKDQALPLPVGYQSRLVDYCLAQVAQQDGDNNLYQIKMQEFATGVSQLKDKPETQADLYPFISVSDRDSGWDW